MIICTCNRATYLARCLASIERLSNASFEVIVVNGPSTDETADVLARYDTRIKRTDNPSTNLSVSRNLGLALAAGDICAFIDDDAIPEPDWLDRLTAAYKDGVGGVGGRVFGPGGDHMQFDFGTIDAWGIARAVRAPEAENEPGQFNIMMGVNSSFRRTAVLAVGGFDEYYEYYHDESDVCIRMVRTGYAIQHEARAIVHHEFAQSHVRRSIHDMNWYPIVKNTVYFGMKNGTGSKVYRMVRSLRAANKRLREWHTWRRDGVITSHDLARFRKMWGAGVWRGLLDGYFMPRRTKELWPEPPAFMPFTTNGQTMDRPHRSDRTLRVCLISQGYPPAKIAGVARYTRTLAHALARRGHQVFVVTETPTELEYDDGPIKVIGVAASDDALLTVSADLPLSRRCLQRSMAIARIVRRIAPIDIVDCSNWDFEGLAASLTGDATTIVRLVTPLSKVIDSQSWAWTPDLLLMCELERQAILQSDGIISSTQANWKLIRESYGIPDRNVAIIPYGVEPPARIDGTCTPGLVLFVGRIEQRKGADTLLQAFQTVRLRHPTATLVLAGQDDEGLSRSAPPGVTVRGYVTEAELDALYRDADFVVVPSVYESFSLICAEAACYGKPVVASAVGGIPEVVLDGKTGILVRPGDTAGFADAIASLLLDRPARNRLAANALVESRTRFSMDRFCDKTEAFYREALLEAGR